MCMQHNAKLPILKTHSAVVSMDSPVPTSHEPRSTLLAWRHWRVPVIASMIPRRRGARGNMVAASAVAVASVAVLVASGVVTAGAARLVRHTQDVPSSVVASACTDDEDCELLGSCRGGVCVCSAGFIGPTCGQLNLAPADATTRGRVWPLTSQPAGTGQIAWSFAPVYDAV